MLSAGSELARRLSTLTVLFVVFGLVMLFSATGVVAKSKFDSEFYYVGRQALAAVFGIMLLILFSKTRYQIWARVAYLLLALQLISVALTFVPGLSYTANAATRWLRLGPLRFQPSEMAKITATIYLSTLLAKHFRKKLLLRQWVCHTVPLLFLLALILAQPDLGTTVLLTFVMLGLCFIAGIRPAYIGGGIAVGAIAFGLAMVHSDYRRRRLIAFLNPWADPQGNGFQLIQSFLSFHSGKFFGVGIGNGNSKLFYLPEVHTDFIFALIGEELGFAGTATLIGLLAYFSYLMYRVAFRCKDRFGCYLAFGLTTGLVLQVAVNLGGVTGLLPLKGLPLPFISWGRSALLVDMIIIGILLNIARQGGEKQEPRNTSAIVPRPMPS